MASIKKIWEKIKPFIEIFKAAKLFYTIFAMSLAYSGYNGFNEVSEYMAEPVVKKVEVENPTVRKSQIVQKDWLPVIDERISKAVKRLEYEYHGGSE